MVRLDSSRNWCVVLKRLKSASSGHFGDHVVPQRCLINSHAECSEKFQLLSMVRIWKSTVGDRGIRCRKTALSMGRSYPIAPAMAAPAHLLVHSTAAKPKTGFLTCPSSSTSAPSAAVLLARCSLNNTSQTASSLRRSRASFMSAR